jgi:uncharacterized PurR-regulated membrane protein YhhQ (DUF165 family)
MNTFTHCILLSFFLIGLTTLAALRSVCLLAISNAIMMTCVSMLGVATFTVFGYATNVGNIFFAAVMYGLTLKYYKFGIVQARAMVNNVLFALVIVYGSIFLLEGEPSLNSTVGAHVRIVGASFVSFSLVQSLFIILLDRYGRKHLLWRVPLITIAMQALNNAVFVPCAFFGHVPSHLVLQYAVVGWLAAAAFALCSMPFLCVVRWIDRDVMTPKDCRRHATCVLAETSRIWRDATLRS